MTRLRAAKVAKIADDIGDLVVDEQGGEELLVVGWGSSFGQIKAGVRRVRAAGTKVAHVQLSHMNPFPKNLGDVLRRFPRVLVPEMNNGQLVRLLRAEFLVDAKSYTKIQGLPFRAAEIETEILKRL
jgi:2-oxoglutarate ferredoxin oxidoreductase subunit alpha